jgi:uncharacterized protein involved in exopolysaccharide biosynthesis
MEPSYAVSLRLFVEAEREGGESYVTRPVLPNELAAEIEAIRDPELLRQVVDENELAEQAQGDGAAEGVDRAVQELADDLVVEPTPESSVISIEYWNKDPQKAAAVVSSLAEIYLERRSRGNAATDDAQANSNRFAAELQAAQAKLEEFEERSRTVLLEDQQRTATLRRSQLNGEKASTETQIKDVEARLGLLVRQAEQLPANVVSQSGGAINEPLLRQLKGLSGVLQEQRTELLTRYEATHRLVREVEQRLSETKTALERVQSGVVVDESASVGPLRRSIDADYLRAQSDLAGLRARREEIVNLLRANEGRQSQLEDVAAQHAELERAVQAAEANYLPYQGREEGAGSGNALGDERSLEVSVLEPPSNPALPPSQSQSLLLLLSLLAAAGAAIGAAVWYDPHLKPAAYVADIATATGAPVLMMIEETQSHVS